MAPHTAAQASRIRGAVFIVAALVLGGPTRSDAQESEQCTATVTAPTQVDDSTIRITATASGSANIPGCQASTSVTVWFAGTEQGTGCPAQTSCTGTFDFGIACKAPGTYTITPYGHCFGYNNSCNYFWPKLGTPGQYVLERPLSVSLSAPAPLPESTDYNVSPTYSIPSTYPNKRVVNIHDARTNAVITACSSEAAVIGPSGTCSPLRVSAPCGRTIIGRVQACDDPQQVAASGEKWLGPRDTDTTTACPLPRDGCNGAPQVGEPINVGSGDVTASIPLFTIDQPAAWPLVFSLQYHSTVPLYPGISNEMGYGWTHSFNSTLRQVMGETADEFLYYVTAIGVERIYERSGTETWVPLRPRTLGETITRVGTEYQLRDLEGNQTSFDVGTGRWLSTSDRWGNTIRAEYSGSSLSKIIDALGREITIVANGSSLQQVILPGGATWRFGYSNGQLTTIHDPVHPVEGPAWRTFEYLSDLLGRPRLLTAMKDETGALLEGHTYDSAGRGTTSYSGSSLAHVSVQYDVPSVGMRRVLHRIDAAQAQTADFTITVKDSRYVATNATGGCASCSGGATENEVRTYDTAGNVISKTAGGATTTYTYDSYGNVSTMTEASGTSLQRTTTYTRAFVAWPAFVTQEDRPGPLGTVSISRTWNADETILTESVTGRTAPNTTPVTVTATTRYDSRHRVIEIDGPRTDVVDVVRRDSYPDDDPDVNRRGRLRTITVAGGLVTTFDSYDVYGTARQITDPNGIVTTAATDARGRVTGQTSLPMSGDPAESSAYSTTTTYDGRDRITEIRAARGNATAFRYQDGTNRRTETVRLGFEANQVERQLVTYNEIGWKTREELQACNAPASVCASWITKQSTDFEYDTNGRLTAIVNADSTRTVYSYDSSGRLSGVQDETHASSNTRYLYDVLSRLSTVEQTLAAAPGGIVTTSYGYDIADNLTSVNDPNGNTTTYLYDDWQRLYSQTSPVTGITTYQHDAAGNVTGTTDANGATTTRTYDASNRLLMSVSTRGGGSEQETYSYDDSTTLIYGRGRVTSMTDPTGTTSYRYDRRGLLRGETRLIGTSSYVTSYSYDANGNRTAIASPAGRTTTYTFDFADRPLTATNGGISLVTAAAYLPFGPLTQVTLGNGSVVTRTFDARYRLTRNQLAAGGVLAQYDYTYSAAGDVLSINDALDPAYNRGFGYDDLHRLSTTTSGAALWGSGSYNYDRMGNLLSVTGVRTSSFSYFTPRPILTQATEQGVSRSVAYDAAGNEITAGSQTFSYSPRNRLASTAPYTYQYDGRGLRVVTASTTNVGVVSVTLDPTTVIGNDPATGTVTLSAPAPTEGAAVGLSSENTAVGRVLTVVHVPAGEVSATFPITTGGPSATATVVIRADFNGTHQSAILTVTPPPSVSTLTISPTEVVGGANATGTVTLDRPEHASGTIVNLSSSNPGFASVPATVTVPPGGLTATFTVTTVSADTTVTISATFGSTRTATLRITTAGGISLQSISVQPGNVVGGAMSPTGVATLSSPAPVGGSIVTLSSSNTAAATVPSSITVTAGATSATFTVGTSTVGATTPVTIAGTYGTTHSTTINVCSCTSCAADVAVLGAETVWFDDALPAGASTSGTWTWDTAQKASGTQSHTNPPATGQTQRYFTGAAAGMSVGQAPADKIVVYALLDPCNPPREIMFQFNAGGSWEQRAYWGENLIAYGTDGTKSRRRLGALPAAGVWTRLEIPVGDVGLCNRTVTGVSFDVYGGKAWFDRIGSVPSAPPAPPSSFPGTDTVWFDDALPGGAGTSGTWTWDATYKASGTQSHTQPPATGSTQRYFTGASQVLPLAAGEKVIVYALLSQCETPREIMLQLNDGTWEHRAYWGENLIGYGTNGTNSRRRIGDLPAAGQWVRLEVPVEDVGLVGRTLTGMSIDVYGGRVWLDRVGKAAAQSGALGELPTTMTSAIAGVTTATTWSKHHLYTPELQLLAETNTSSTPAVAYEYVWFNGEPLAQIEIGSGAIHYYFNDHLGAPVLTTNSSGTVDWRVEREPYGQIFNTRVGVLDRHQPLGLPGQEYDPGDPERQYNIFRWYRAGWGRYTQADPAWDRLLAREGAVSHYMYARDNPILWTDPEGLAVRVCCRPVNAPGLRQYDHCYIESNTNGGRTWGLHNQHGQGVYRMNDPSDEGGICSNWKPDPCPNNDCFTRESAKYPLEPYSFVGANTNGAGFSGRNSNTFVKCIMQRCDVPFVDTRVTRNAPGWYQPCP